MVEWALFDDRTLVKYESEVDKRYYRRDLA